VRAEEAVEARRSAPADDPSQVGIADLALTLGTDLERGLGADEAVKRLRADGPNELRAVTPVPAWRHALKQLKAPLVYLIGAAAAVALAAWWFEGQGRPGAASWPLDATVIAYLVLLNAMLGWLQEAKAAPAVAALAKMTTAMSAMLRDGAVAWVPSAELVTGDLLVLAEGDAMGADASLVQAAALKLLEATLTGESEAVLKDAAPLPGLRKSVTGSTWSSRARRSRRAAGGPLLLPLECRPRWPASPLCWTPHPTCQRRCRSRSRI
jgi:Ca2+-transporting ATPase